MSTSSAIIEDIIVVREAESASIAYFYCDFRDEDKQSYRNILLSILFRAFETSGEIRSKDVVKDAFSGEDKRSKRDPGVVLPESLS